ncbi:diguanylate cyclase (GGDEF)-like protein [Oceanisphaera litoralis]|uniref:GGDEF domain-containing protein n=1 Tax=Oceanisphaera litoralis TaxID=225144 RepID=UPI00195C9E71|nr:GGDEF domain-containing protein [Oceanisphaera litoralis]MBM7455629.1 diguanylate cyclase (GGDEF)-like protein [Oceanisphaera litoralis]
MHKLSHLERDPTSLQRLLLICGVVSIFLILSLTWVGIQRAATNSVLTEAEYDSNQIAKLIVAQHYNLLFSDGEQNIAMDNHGFNTFDQTIKDMLHLFGIVKIKVFDLDGVIIYSTDANIIGIRVEDSPGLEKALRGETDSHQVTKELVIDLHEEQRFDVDVVETYLPVYNISGEIAGSFEVYLDVTRYRNEISYRVSSALLLLASILMGVFLLSFWVVNKGSKQLKALLNRLEQQAITDTLTGLINRGAVLHRAEEELSRMQRHVPQEPVNSLGVIMVDLDFFKAVNDTYGHQVGDEVLREMSRRVTARLREYDVFGRYGGEEFLVLTPGCTREEAMMLAERIRRCLADAPIIIGKHRLEITVSLGVTCCLNPEEGFESALSRADHALYEAKHLGRNRAVFSGIQQVWDVDGVSQDVVKPIGDSLYGVDI